MADVVLLLASSTCMVFCHPVPVTLHALQIICLQPGIYVILHIRDHACCWLHQAMHMFQHIRDLQRLSLVNCLLLVADLVISGATHLQGTVHSGHCSMRQVL
jgi:hypothetical protein